MTPDSGTRSRPGNGRSPLGPGRRPPRAHPEGADAVRLRITLKDIAPAPWRVVDVPLSLTLAALHNVIQAAFCWWNYHLWEFQIGEHRVAVPDEEDEWEPDPRPFADARNFPLSRCLTWGVDRMIYLYDFGDYWQHEVRLETAFRAEDLYSLPAFLRWRVPGPPPARTVEAPAASPISSKRSPIPSIRSARNCSSGTGGPFDPANIYEDRIREGMALIRGYRMARRRKARRPGPAPG